jgi:hypothetical protein
MEGGNATDGAGGTDETGKEVPMRESSLSPTAKTERSIKERNLPFGLGMGIVGLVEVARPSTQAPDEASQSLYSATKAAMPSTNVETNQAAMSSTNVGTKQAVMPSSNVESKQAAMPSTNEETMMLCPQAITPILYETGIGQATASLVSLGNVKGVEAFRDIIMEEALGGEGNDFQEMLDGGKPILKQSPSPPRDCYEQQTDYGSDGSVDAFTTNATYIARFFDQREQSQDEARANVDEREKSQTKAQASDPNILADKDEDRAQAQHNPSNDLTLSVEEEQPILTQQKVMDLIMQQQALPTNNTLEGLAATSWTIKKQGFKDMLSGFQSPT